MAIEKELLDQLLEGRDPETVFTQDGLLDELNRHFPDSLQIHGNHTQIAPPL